MCSRTGRCDPQDVEAEAAEAAAQAEVDDFEEQEAMPAVYRDSTGMGGALGSALGAHGAALSVWPPGPAVALAGSRVRSLHFFGCGAGTTLFRVFFCMDLVSTHHN